jgi:amidohydrolase
MNPEVAFSEFETTNLIRETLSLWKIQFHPFTSVKTGGYAEVGDGKAYAFRSDIDALPIHESDSHEIKSVKSGFMHACGHDYHTAIGLGLLRYFNYHKEKLPGKFRVVFQPAEESAPGGAQIVAQEDIWNDVGGIITTHVDPGIKPGMFVLFNGPAQASSTSVYIELCGPGGHTSKAFESVDLISVACTYVVQLQNYISAHSDPREPFVFAFGSINGGETHNVIPQKIGLRGTLRTYNNSKIVNLQNMISNFSDNFSGTYNIQSTIQFPSICPATINDPVLYHKFYEFMSNSNRLNELIISGRPSFGADDFAFYLDKVPGLYLIIGGAGSGSLHSGDLELNESLIAPTLNCLINFIPTLYN